MPMDRRLQYLLRAFIGDNLMPTSGSTAFTSSSVASDTKRLQFYILQVYIIKRTICHHAVRIVFL